MLRTLEENRAIAKLFGGKALTGSKSQKNWGERIRADKLLCMTKEEAIRACTSTYLKSAKAWIDNRDRRDHDFDAVIDEQKNKPKLTYKQSIQKELERQQEERKKRAEAHKQKIKLLKESQKWN